MSKKDGIKGVTSSGFQFEIPKERLNNYELIEAISDLDENPLVLPKVVRLLLGDEQTKKIKNHVRNAKTKIVDAEKLSNEITEIFASQEIKN